MRYLSLLLFLACPLLASAGEEYAAFAGPFSPSPAVKATATAADVMKNRMLTDYVVASQKAASEKKILYVWVAYNCPSSAVQLPEAVHVFVPSFQGDTTQRVVVATPHHDWLAMRGTVMAEDCCASSLRRMAEPMVPPLTGGSWSFQPQSRGPSAGGMWSMGGMMRGGSHGDCAT